MVIYIAEQVFRQFLVTGQDMADGRVDTQVCRDKKIIVPGVKVADTSSYFRIMTKYGLMQATKKSDGLVEYSITPKGLAVLDFFKLSSSKQP